jgi:hypothetical protein
MLTDAIRKVNTAYREYGRGNELHTEVSNYLQLGTLSRNYLPPQKYQRIDKLYKKIQSKWWKTNEH